MELTDKIHKHITEYLGEAQSKIIELQDRKEHKESLSPNEINLLGYNEGIATLARRILNLYPEFTLLSKSKEYLDNNYNGQGGVIGVNFIEDHPRFKGEKILTFSFFGSMYFGDKLIYHFILRENGELYMYKSEVGSHQMIKILKKYNQPIDGLKDLNQAIADWKEQKNYSPFNLI